MRARAIAVLVTVGMAGVASAAEPSAPVAAVLIAATAPAPAPPRAAPHRLKLGATPPDPTFRVDDPASMLRRGYGGSLIDLFPVRGGKFHLSGGARLFGRAGRVRGVQPESLRYLPSFRTGGPRVSRRFSPTMLVGYGRVVDRGLAFGIDAGVTMGRIGLSADRLGRLNRRRLDSTDGRGRRTGINQLARVTALYRF